MTTNELATRQAGDLAAAARTFLAGKADNTQRAYNDRLGRFFDWRAGQPAGPFVAQLAEYIAELQQAGMSPRSVQAHVATIKGLLRTAAALDTSGELARLLPSLDLARAPAVRGEIQGKRETEDERQALLDAPGIDTHKGRRDTAILALCSVCGLRRSEVCGLNWRHIAELDGHHVILNMSGKHGRVRTVKLPPSLYRRIVEYAELAGLDRSPDAPVFVSIRKGDTVQPGKRLTGSSIAYIVEQRARAVGQDIAPHDLRRTAASLARKAGANIEQVQAMLGHASPQTTSAYIGAGLDLDNHAVDFQRARIP